MAGPSPEHFTDQIAVQATRSRLLQPGIFEALLQALVEQLPRRLVPIALRPIDGVKSMNVARGHYLSLSGTPLFEIDTHSPLQAGWYYLEAALVRNNGGREARLIMQRENERVIGEIVISSNLRGSVREVIFIPEPCTRTLWQPTTARGLFTQSPLVLHKITSAEATLRRWHRVLVDRWRFRHMLRGRRENLSIRHALSKLQAAYLATSQMRLRRADPFNDHLSFIRSEKALREACSSAKHLARRRKLKGINLLLVVNSGDTLALPAMLNALRAQSFAAWSLIVVPTERDMLPSLRELCEPDERVRIFPPCVSDDSADWNTALNVAAGDVNPGLIGLIAPGIVLARDALLVLAAESERQTAADVFYCDEDELELKSGTHCNPLRKPDWNPELLLSTPYFGSSVFVRSAHFLARGGFRHELKEAALYDLALRVTHALPSSKIAHLPFTLMHNTAATTAPDSAAALRALRSLLGTQSTVITGTQYPNVFRLRHRIEQPAPLISIIIPTRDRPDLLGACVSSVLERTTYPSWELLVADNGSADPGALALLEQLSMAPSTRVLRMPGPFNFSKINNDAARHAKGQVLVLLNDDTDVITPDWLEELVSHAMRDGIGAVGAKLLYPDNSVQHGGVILGVGGIAAHAHRFLPHDAPGHMNLAVSIQAIAAVTGACLAVRREHFEAVGGLDESLAVAFNDIDFCLRLRQTGLRNVFTPWAQLYHHESLSRGLDDSDAKRRVYQQEKLLMQERWGGLIKRNNAQDMLARSS